MEYLRFVLYGLIQGLTEFIPVSSTAHLKVTSILFGIDDPGPSLSAIIQLGSIFALFWYFRDDIFLLKKTNTKEFPTYLINKRIRISIFIGTIPILFMGLFIRLFIPNFFNNFLRSNFSIGIVSLLMATLMIFADNSKTKFINITNHKYRDSFFIGIAQALAIIPGVSRSGATISIALLSGWERRDSAKFSFLLGIPSITLAAIFEFFFYFNKTSGFPLYPLIFGLITTFLSSLVAIDFFIKYLSNRGMKLFIYYRFIFGILILLNL